MDNLFKNSNSKFARILLNLVNNHGLIAFNKTCDSVFLFFQSKSGLIYINEPEKFMSFWSSQWKDYYNKYQNRDQFINEIYSSLHIVKSILN